MENEIKTGVIPLPEKLKKAMVEIVNETLRELGASKQLPKGVEFRLGYAAGCRDTINHLIFTGQFKRR